MELNSQSFPNYIKSKAYKFLKESAKTESLGDPNDLDMNSMVEEPKMDSTAKVEVKKGGAFKVKSRTETKDETTKVDMAEMDGEHGEKGAVVSVETKKKEVKKTQPSKDASTPFEVEGEKEMNTMDEEGSDETKTFVKAGGSMGSDQPTNVGMKKPDFKKEAENEKADKPIADAIQIPEGLTFKNRNELLEYCKKEAERVSKLLS
jgi:hypothetical protein